MSISIYVHWPFCLSKCPYCDFNSHVAASFDYKLWKKLYQSELHYFRDQIEGKAIRSIFFGGGTPSLMSGELVESVIQACANMGKLQNDTEISLEANPSSFDREKFADFASCGVNRISIGMQSLNDARLKYLGRLHNASDALKAFNSARALFRNVSADFIYATPGHSLDSWAEELKKILALRANHLSLYQLVIEENTKFHSKLLAGKMNPIASDDAYELYEYTNSKAFEAGYERYEVSNYADRSQNQCKHNLNYWNYNAYVGIGPGAHSRIMENDEVWAVETHLSPKIWSDSVLEKGHGISKRTLLQNQEIISELLFMGLRTNYGVELLRLKKLVGAQWSKMSSAIDLLSNEGLIEVKKGKLLLSSKGMALHTELVYALVSSVEEAS